MAINTTVGVGEFRQHATEYIRLVEETKQIVTILRRGTAVAELRPVEAAPTALAGSVTYVEGVDLSEPVVPAEDWEAAR